MSDFYEEIREYCLVGYGLPRRYYGQKELALFVKQGLLSPGEAAQILKEKDQMG